VGGGKFPKMMQILKGGKGTETDKGKKAKKKGGM